jgi:hypothetical protein
MCLWPENGPEGKWWYARWSDEDAAKKVIGRSCGEAIHNCLTNVEAAVVWDEEVIHERAQRVSAFPESKSPTVNDSEAQILKTVLAAQAILAPANLPKAPNEAGPIQQLEEVARSVESQSKVIETWWGKTWNWLLTHLASHQARKRLRVCETVSLGEKRFVAVVEVDGEQFLVGGAASSVATLARLKPSPNFSEVLKSKWSQEPVQA